MEIPPDDPRAAGLVLAVRAGDTEAISRLLAGDPRLWHVARLLVARGARIGSLWEAAGLGDRAAVDEFLAADPPPSAHDVDEAFWQACHGGQRRMAEYLLARGADVNVVPGYSEQTAWQAAGEVDTRRQILVDWLTERGAGRA